MWTEVDRRLRELSQVGRAMGLLSWDRQVMMPPGGVDARARTESAIAVLRHRLLTSAELGNAIEEAAGEDLDPHQAASVRLARRARDRAVKLPPDLVGRIGIATARGNSAWEVARRDQDFAQFEPHLTEIVALKREQAALLSDGPELYDALLDMYEPGMTAAVIEPLFGALETELSSFVAEIGAVAKPVPSPAREPLSAEAQMAFSRRILPDLGYNMEGGRLDLSVHPFSIGLAQRDARITTRTYLDDPFGTVLATIHEAGHAMYEQGMDPAYEDLPVASAPSLGLHESQSRLWENVIGRSREYWEHYTPVMAEVVGAPMRDATVDNVYRWVNRVEPSFIRVEADEVTYNLHVVIRFRLELALIRGDLEVADLPEAWNAAYEQTLGIVPPNAAEGVLQDTHWSGGSFGYFPTYTLGSIYASMLWDTLEGQIPDARALIRAAEFGPILEWLRREVHRPGSLYEGEDLIERVTGSRLDHRPLMRYLRSKFGQIYGLNGA